MLMTITVGASSMKKLLRANLGGAGHVQARRGLPVLGLT